VRVVHKIAAAACDAVVIALRIVPASIRGQRRTDGQKERERDAYL